MSTPSVLLIPDLLKAGKLYSQIPNSGAVDFDVTRATTAYRTNASGILESVASGVPRLDYPIGGGCPSLLVEPAATNLLLQSQTLQTTWTAGDVTLSVNATPAPDGTTTAEKIVVNATNTFHQLDQVPTLADNTTYTISVFAKKAELNWVSFACSNKASTTYIAWFNLDTGVVGTIQAGATARITPFGNGYFRCEMSFPSQTGAGTTRQRIRVNSADNQFTWLGNGTDGIFLWGAQLETGSVATSYIPTAAATATRNADVISKTGVSGFIGQAFGTIYAEVDVSRAVLGTILTIDAGNTSDYFTIVKIATGAIRVNIKKTSTSAVTLFTSSALSIGSHKIGFGYENGNYVLYIDGVLIATSSNSTDYPTAALSRVELSSTSYGVFNDRIRAAAIYPTRLTNSQLSALTTL